MQKEIKEKRISEIAAKTDATINIVLTTAARYGFVDGGLRRSKGDLMRKRRPYLSQLKKLKNTIENLENNVQNIEEYKKKKKEFIRNYIEIKEEMHNETKEEQREVNRFNKVVKILDNDIRNLLKAANFYRLHYEIPPQLEERIGKG